MADMMTFPDTVEEFMEQYKVVDTDHVYTNGADMVPIFRMKQWFEHQVRTQISVPDCISRQAVRLIKSDSDAYPQEWNDDYEKGFTDALNKVIALPSAQPEIIRCGECAHKDKKIDYCHYLGITICECDYCSYAVRRTDG